METHKLYMQTYICIYIYKDIHKCIIDIYVYIYIFITWVIEQSKIKQP